MSSDEANEDVEWVKKLLYIRRQAKAFRILSIIVGAIALGVCVIIYNQQAEGNILKLLEKPLLLLYMFFPFVPSLALARLYFKKAQEFEDKLEEAGIDISSLQ